MMLASAAPQRDPLHCAGSKVTPYCEERVRAGWSEHAIVQMLRKAGVSERLEREGLRHEGIELGLHGVRHKYR